MRRFFSAIQPNLCRFLIVLTLLVCIPLYVESQSVNIVFSENFDQTSSLQPWSPYFSSGWFRENPYNILQAESGKGQVLKVNFFAGSIGSESGIGNYRIPLDSSYKELYFSWEYFIPSFFNYGFDDGNGGGKFFGGLAGGSMMPIPNDHTSYMDGWASMLLFHNGTYATYNYFKGTTYTSDGWPAGHQITSLVKGQWRRVTIRLKINDGDLANGIFEVFDNDVLAFQQTNVKVVNGYHPEYLIEHLYLTSFFGGSGPSYASPIDQYMEFDNLVAFYYPPGSAGYRSGPSEKGRTLEVPAASSYHPDPPNKFTPAEYTDASGTVVSHCAFHQPVDHPSYFETSTIKVSGASYLRINVLQFDYDSTISPPGSQQILKIYRGTGTGRTLVRTYQKNVYTAPGMIEISGNSATLEWQAGQGAHGGFRLSYTSDGTGSGKNCGCGNYLARQAGTIKVPAAPSSLVSTSLGMNSASFSWSDNSDNESLFEIERRGPDNKVQILQSAANTTAFTDTELQQGSVYAYRIRAYNAVSGYSAYSNALEITTMAPVPAAPTSFTLTLSNGSASLQWTDNSTNESWFEIERRGPNDNSLVQTFQSPANVTSYTDTGIQPESVYAYRIRAYNKVSGYSSYTISIQIKTLPPGPNAPSSLALISVSDNAASLQWTDNSANESGFEMERRGPDDNNLVQSFQLPANTTAFTDSRLLPGSVYTYRLRAYDQANGYSSYSNPVEVSIPMPAPAAPSSLVLENLSSLAVSFRWTDNSKDESRFEIERRGPNDSSLVQILISGANTTVFTDSGVVMNAYYTYRVRACNTQGGYSLFSNTLDITTPMGFPPKAPSLLQSKEFTHESITIRWNDNSNDEDGFEITRSLVTDELNRAFIRVSRDDTLYTDKGLEPGKTYVYTVKAINNAGSSANSNRKVASTLSIAETKRVKDGLIAYYNFNYNPDYIVYDLSGFGEPLDLKIQQPSSVRWGSHNTLEVLSAGMITSTVSAGKITSALKKTKAITLECWIRPDEPAISNTSRLISLASDNDDIGFVLDQRFTNLGNEKSMNYCVRLKTRSTNSSGYPEIVLPDNIQYSGLQHIVYVHDSAGNETLYFNGEKVAGGYRPGDFSTWSDNCFLRIGNEKDQNLGWTGAFYSVALFNKALSFSNIAHNYALGPCDSIQMNGVDFQVKVFPNPLHGEATIEIIPENQQDILPRTLIKVVDVYGRILHEEVIFNPQNKITLNLDRMNVNKGLCFLQVISGSKHKTSKLIIQ